MKRKKRPQLPCIFANGATRGAIDDRVKAMWVETFGEGPVPFGDLRLSFKRFHCGTINPMGGQCEVDPRECARAFLGAVQEVCVAHRIRNVANPAGYFVRVARSTGARRADEAVAARARGAMLRRTSVYPSPPTTPQPLPDPRGLGAPGPAGQGSGSAGRPALDGRDGEAPAQGDRSDASLPSSRHGPVSVGDLFGGLALGPREGRSDDRTEGPR